MNHEVKQCILDLAKIGAIKRGDFTLKSGRKSSLYIDLRLIISYPELVKSISHLMWKEISHLSFDYLCGVPYTALPLATTCSLYHHIPMVMRRKEIKDYGTKKIIEGVFTPGKSCLVMEDLVTTGASLLETIAPLEDVGLKVKELVAFVDREEGGREELYKKGYELHTVVKLSEMLEVLKTHDLFEAR